MQLPIPAAAYSFFVFYTRQGLAKALLITYYPPSIQSLHDELAVIKISIFPSSRRSFTDLCGTNGINSLPLERLLLSNAQGSGDDDDIFTLSPYPYILRTPYEYGLLLLKGKVADRL